MHALGSKDLGQKDFRSLTSIITKLHPSSISQGTLRFV